AAPGGPCRSCGPCVGGAPPRRTPSRTDLRPDAPATPPGFARLDGDHVAARPERVRRAGHRLQRDRAPVAVAVQGVPGEHLPPAELRVGPHLTGTVTLRAGQHRARRAVVVAD